MKVQILNLPIRILVSVSAKEYCDYISNIKCFNITLT